MKGFRKIFGKNSEQIARNHLKKCGYRILEENYRLPSGEIDIIAMDGDTLVFIEVKARNSERYGSPKQAVDLKKQKKISNVALQYLKKNGKFGTKARFDVVAIKSNSAKNAIEVVKNAFELS